MKLFICDRCSSKIDGNAGVRSIQVEGFKFQISQVQTVPEDAEGRTWSEAHLCTTCLATVVSKWAVLEHEAWKQSKEWEEEKRAKAEEERASEGESER